MLFQNVSRSREIGDFDPKYLRQMQQVQPKPTELPAILPPEVTVEVKTYEPEFEKYINRKLYQLVAGMIVFGTPIIAWVGYTIRITPIPH